MAYPSVDHLQNLLAKEVFHYAKDAKKAAGRSLGTLVEIIAFYCLKSWGFEHNTAIERPLPNLRTMISPTMLNTASTLRCRWRPLLSVEAPFP